VRISESAASSNFCRAVAPDFSFLRPLIILHTNQLVCSQAMPLTRSEIVVLEIKTPQWMADRVGHYRSVAERCRSKTQRAFRGLALAETASHSTMRANLDTPSRFIAGETLSRNMCRAIGLRIRGGLRLPVTFKLFGQCPHQSAVRRIANEGQACGDIVGCHARSDQHGRDGGGNLIGGQAHIDADVGCGGFAAADEIFDEKHFGESALQPSVQASAQRVVPGEIGREHGMDQRRAIVVESFAQCRVSKRSTMACGVSASRSRGSPSRKQR
jgi:hypothetical protein